MKEKEANRPTGDHTEEEEIPPEAEEEKGAGEGVTQHQDRQDPLPEETRSPPDLTSLLTYDPFPALTMQSQWENSPTSLMGTEPKQRRSSTSLTTISYSTSTSLVST